MLDEIIEQWSKLEQRMGGDRLWRTVGVIIFAAAMGALIYNSL